MDVGDTTLTFSRALWVQYGGVDATEQGARIVVTGRDEDSYLKVFNHFGRVLKLYTFEGGRWIDTDTGMRPQPLDESQAGRLPETAAPAAPRPAPRAGAKAGAKPAAKAGARAGAKTGAKPAAKAGAKAARKGG